MSIHPLPPPVPVLDAHDALFIFRLAATEPACHETLAFLLDDEGHGGVVVLVHGTFRPDALFEVVTHMIEHPYGQSGRRLVVASVRPHVGLLPGDVDRWLEASECAEAHGFELVEWFVLGPHGPQCPRDLLGEPERW